MGLCVQGKGTRRAALCPACLATTPTRCPLVMLTLPALRRCPQQTLGLPLSLCTGKPSPTPCPPLRSAAAHLSTLPLNVIIAPLHTVPTTQNMMAYGLPVAVPCHTASITPRVRVISAASSWLLGYRDSTRMASTQVTTGMAELRHAREPAQEGRSEEA